MRYNKGPTTIYLLLLAVCSLAALDKGKTREDGGARVKERKIVMPSAALFYARGDNMRHWQALTLCQWKWILLWNEWTATVERETAVATVVVTQKKRKTATNRQLNSVHRILNRNKSRKMKTIYELLGGNVYGIFGAKALKPRQQKWL